MAAAVPESLEAVYLPVGAVAGDPDPRRFRVKWSGTVQARDDPFLAEAAGVLRGSSGKGSYIYSSKGPMLTPTVQRSPDLGNGGGLYQDTRLPDQPFRALHDIEVWQANGHAPDLWRTLIEQGQEEAARMRACI